MTVLHLSPSISGYVTPHPLIIAPRQIKERDAERADSPALTIWLLGVAEPSNHLSRDTDAQWARRKAFEGNAQEVGARVSALSASSSCRQYCNLR